MLDLSRRQFIVVSAVAAAGFSVFRSLPMAVAAEDAASADPVDAGPVSAYASDGVTDTFARSRKFLIVRQDGKLYAPSALCTHKRCTVKARDGAIACPCHGSRYAADGQVTRGPARQPLPRHRVALVNGRVMVDTAQTFGPDRWNDPAAFIAVK